MSTRKIGTVLDELDADRTVYRSSAKDVFVVSRDEGKFGKPTFYAVLAHNRRIIAKAYGNPGPHDPPRRRTAGRLPSRRDPRLPNAALRRPRTRAAARRVTPSLAPISSPPAPGNRADPRRRGSAFFRADRESPRYSAASLPAAGAAVDARRVPPVLGRGSSPFSR